MGRGDLKVLKKHKKKKLIQRQADESRGGGEERMKKVFTPFRDSGVFNEVPDSEELRAELWGESLSRSGGPGLAVVLSLLFRLLFMDPLEVSITHF
ncbi:unnamed protein product [Allacma fusca]|uniref:Uncharacterized protein n=1 Tax=Allacma fusca TaxID=39272 RepID=A0A8J2JT68_9HEXA|nr:unnamed protein product [Allacma fusca]